MKLDQLIEWWPNLIGLALFFWLGIQWEKAVQKTKDEELRQREFDLGILFPVLAEWTMGVKTREQADDEMRRSSYRSARHLWFSMSEDERTRLGRRAVELASDREFLR